MAPTIRVVTLPLPRPELLAVLPDDAQPLPHNAAWLDPEHLIRHAGEADVLHLHVGHEDLFRVGSPRRTAAWAEQWTAAVRRAGVPLVLTVHDLRDPDDEVRAHLDALLAALLDTAEVVLALTAGAADEIADRYGRTAIAVGHPVQVTRVEGVDRETRLVGVHLGSLPANLPEPVPVVRAALSGALSGGGRLRVDVDADVYMATRLPELIALDRQGELELHVHEPYCAQQQVGYLQQLHVSVLPHRFGTDAGWLETGRDVGTRLVAPSSGHYRELWSDVVDYGHDEDGGLDTTSLTMAVVAALTRPAPGRPDPQWRTEQRLAVQRVHAEIYAQVVADRLSTG